MQTLEKSNHKSLQLSVHLKIKLWMFLQQKYDFKFFKFRQRDSEVTKKIDRSYLF